MPTYTSKFNLIKPLPFDLTDADVWGGYLNENFDDIDGLLERAMEWLVVPKGANYPVVSSDYKTLFAANASTASFNITLPLASANIGLTVGIKKVDSTANTVTVLTTGSDQIDGQANVVLSAQYEDLYVVSDGTSWNAISKIVIASQIEAEAGTNNTKAMSPLRVFQAISKWVLTYLGFNKGFESAEQAITSPFNIVVPHLLTLQPKIFNVVLRCVSSEYGYGVGDEIAQGQVNIAGSYNVSTWSSSVNVGITGVNTPVIMRRDIAGNAITITPANWRWVLRAWA